MSLLDARSRLQPCGPQLLFAQAAAAIGEHLFLFAQSAVAVVDRREAEVELAFLALEPRLCRDDVTLAIRNVGFTRLDARDRLGEPVAALGQLGGRPFE